MQPIISLHMWVSLPNEVRHRIRALFSIPRSSNTVVNDGRIETDGTTNEDFKHLTIDKMQKYLNDTSSDFHKLFDMVVAKVVDEIQAPKNPVVNETPIVIPKKRGRPSKNK